MGTHYQNRLTGEIKFVESDEEIAELAGEVGPDGDVVWGVKSDATDAPPPAIPDTLPGAGPEENASANLTAAEIEMGLTPDQKAYEVSQMFGTPEPDASLQDVEDVAPALEDGGSDDNEGDEGQGGDDAEGSDDTPPVDPAAQAAEIAAAAEAESKAEPKTGKAKK